MTVTLVPLTDVERPALIADFQESFKHFQGNPQGSFRLLHQRLCGWIDPGKTGKASIDTLCGYVWPSEASGSTMRKRRQRVREALPELVALGWTVTEFAAGKYDITRPKAAG